MAASAKKPKYHLESPQTDIYVGDCRQVLPTLKAESVDLVFADPPFNWDFEYDGWYDSLSRPDYLKFTTEWLDGCVRVLAPHGSLWVNIPDDWAADVVVYLRKQHRLEMVNWCIWHFRFGQHKDTSFIVSKVHVLYFARDRKQRTWNPDAVLEPSDRASIYGDERTTRTRRPGKRVPLDVWYGPYFGRIQGNNKERRRNHSNQIPEAYLARIIMACSNEGDLVLDPFLGSGTTCTVARALGRRSIGIERGPKSAASALARINQGPARPLNQPRNETNSFMTRHKRSPRKPREK